MALDQHRKEKQKSAKGLRECVYTPMWENQMQRQQHKVVIGGLKWDGVVGKIIRPAVFFFFLFWFFSLFCVWGWGGDGGGGFALCSPQSD